MYAPILKSSNCSPSCDYQVRFLCSLEKVTVILWPNRVRFRVQLFRVRRHQCKQVRHNKSGVSPRVGKSLDTPKRRIQLRFVCNTRIQPNPGT